ncbi:MAG: 30S ribosomal protein S6 [Candidatus Omnitrophica bacterium]|nr:30S ribosomal protein S6 [Candidatus Omnitrophota bacterium]
MEKVRSYTGLFIITPEKPEAIDDVKRSITAVINDNSGKILKDNMIGRKNLAYPIKKNNSGIYYEVTFSAVPESISKIQRMFNINTDILRSLIDLAG